MSERQPLSRREFLKISGGGIFVFFAVGDPLDLLEAQERMGGRELPADWNAFLRIAEDGTVTGFTGKAELGQGANTALAQLAAEELDVPLDSVTMVLGDTDLCPWDMGTFGSRTIKYFGPPFRQAAAEARGVLVQLASEKLGVPAARLAVKGGAVFDTAVPKNSVTYGALAMG
jgi:nicotinate dehydrogenase subunit B